MLFFSSFSVTHVSFDVVILRSVVVRKPWRRTFVPMDMKNFCTAFRPKPQGESCATDCGGDVARKHRTRRGTSRLLDTRHDTRMIKVCKRDAELQHDLVWLHVGFASAHDAQAHEDHDTTVVECHCCDVDGVQQSGDRAVRAKRSLADSKFGQTRFEPPLSFSSSSAASAPLPRLPPPTLLRVRAPNSPGDAWQLSCAVEFAAVPAPGISLRLSLFREALSVSLLSLFLLFSFKNASRVPWRTRHSLVAQTRTSVQMRTSGPKKGRTKEGSEIWPSGEHGVSRWRWNVWREISDKGLAGPCVCNLVLLSAKCVPWWRSRQSS